MIEWIPIAEARERALEAAAELGRDPRVRLVFLFGSAAEDGCQQVRDVDLGVWTEPPLDLWERVRWQSRLGPGIDLVPLNEASIVLAWEVATTGRCLYAADPDLELTYRIRARSRYWDFKPYLDRQWQWSRERAEARSHGGQG